MLREIDIPRDGNADRLASVVSFHGNQIKIGTDGFKNQEREIVFDSCRVGTEYKKFGTSTWHAKRDPNGNYLVKKGAEQISQEDILSIILKQIKAK
uniref:Uncharacterized protein n=1 Tax=Acrobeloides nanus TaxID=290746 RepID=A0A914EKQ1_9BILA